MTFWQRFKAGFKADFPTAEDLGGMSAILLHFIVGGLLILATIFVVGAVVSCLS